MGTRGTRCKVVPNNRREKFQLSSDTLLPLRVGSSRIAEAWQLPVCFKECPIGSSRRTPLNFRAGVEGIYGGLSHDKCLEMTGATAGSSNSAPKHRRPCPKRTRRLFLENHGGGWGLLTLWSGLPTFPPERLSRPLPHWRRYRRKDTGSVPPDCHPHGQHGRALRSLHE